MELSFDPEEKARMGGGGGVRMGGGSRIGRMGGAVTRSAGNTQAPNLRPRPSMIKGNTWQQRTANVVKGAVWDAVTNPLPLPFKIAKFVFTPMPAY
jgi:hypothetical protein